MAGELPIVIQEQLANEITHTSRNNAPIVSAKISMLGLDVLAVKLEAGGVRSDVRTHGPRCAAEHVSVAFMVTLMTVAVMATHFEGAAVSATTAAVMR